MVKKLKSEKYKGFTIDFIKTKGDVHTKLNDFPKKGEHKVFYTPSKLSGLSYAKTYIDNLNVRPNSLPVGKNIITYDNDTDGWIIEVREFVNNGVPMYSIWDVVRSKIKAIEIAKKLTPENSYKEHMWYIENNPYIFVRYTL